MRKNIIKIIIAGVSLLSIAMIGTVTGICDDNFVAAQKKQTEMIQSGNYIYDVLNETGKEAALRKITGYKSELVIPAKVDGYTITQLGMSQKDIEADDSDKANIISDNDSKVTKLVIPDTVKTIGEYAFHKMNSLKELVFPKSLSSIGANNFVDAGKLKQITFKSNITIGNNCFDNVVFDKVTAYGDFNAGNTYDYEMGGKIKKLILKGNKAKTSTVYLSNGFNKIDKVIVSKNVKTLSIYYGKYGEIEFEGDNTILSVNFNNIILDKVSVPVKAVKTKKGGFIYDWKKNNLGKTQTLDDGRLEVQFKVLCKKNGKFKCVKITDKSNCILNNNNNAKVIAQYKYKSN